MTALLLRAIRRFERAATEYRRAKAAGAQPRLNRAGTAYGVAKFNLFRMARQVRAQEPGQRG